MAASGLEVVPPTPPPTTSGTESAAGDANGDANALTHDGINGSFSAGKVSENNLV